MIIRKYLGEFLYILSVGFVYIFGLYTLKIKYYNIGFGSLYLLIFALFLIFFGLTVWILGFFALGRSFFILPSPIAKKRLKKGIYSIIKHPIYLGITLFFVGCSLAQGNIKGLNFSLFMLIPFHLLRIYLEERHLKDI